MNCDGCGESVGASLLALCRYCRSCANYHREKQQEAMSSGHYRRRRIRRSINLEVVYAQSE